MAYNTVAAANKIVTILSGLSGVGAAALGMPASLDVRLGAYVTMGSQRPVRKVTGIMQRETRLFVKFLYRLDKAESTAESSLMTAVDAFLAALQSDLTLDGTVNNLEIDTALADEPDYQAVAGKEFREYPILVTVTQYGTFEVNP